jgi:hypothetical protein
MLSRSDRFMSVPFDDHEQGLVLEVVEDLATDLDCAQKLTDIFVLPTTSELWGLSTKDVLHISTSLIE